MIANFFRHYTILWYGWVVVALLVITGWAFIGRLSAEFWMWLNEWSYLSDDRKGWCLFWGPLNIVGIIVVVTVLFTVLGLGYGGTQLAEWLIKKAKVQYKKRFVKIRI